MSSGPGPWELRRACLLADGRTLALCEREGDHGVKDPCAVVLEACGSHVTIVSSDGTLLRRVTETAAYAGPYATAVALALAFRNTYAGAPMLPFVCPGGIGAGGVASIMSSALPLRVVRWAVGCAVVQDEVGGGVATGHILARAANADYRLYYPLLPDSPARVVRVVTLARIQGAPPQASLHTSSAAKRMPLRVEYARVSQTLTVDKLPTHFKPALEAVLGHISWDIGSRYAAAMSAFAAEAATAEGTISPIPVHSDSGNTRGGAASEGGALDGSSVVHAVARVPEDHVTEVPLSGSGYWREGAGGVESGARFTWSDTARTDGLAVMRKGADSKWLPATGSHVVVDWTPAAVYIICEAGDVTSVEVLVNDGGTEMSVTDGFARLFRKTSDGSASSEIFAVEAFPVTFAHVSTVAHAVAVLDAHKRGAAAAAAAAAVPAVSVPPRVPVVMAEQHVPGWGTFIALSDGLVRVTFVDRTLLKMWPVSLPSAAAVGGSEAPGAYARRIVALLPSGDEIVVPMESANHCAVPALRPYVAAAVEFEAWLRLSPEEKAGQTAARMEMEAVIRQCKRECEMQTLLEEAERAVAAGWKPPVTLQDLEALEATWQSLQPPGLAAADL